MNQSASRKDLLHCSVFGKMPVADMATATMNHVILQATLLAAGAHASLSSGQFRL